MSAAALLRTPVHAVAAAEHPVDALLALYARLGAQSYGTESISQLAHALQSAWLAEMAAAPDSLIAAALLHDVGHLLQEDQHEAPREDHAAVGARWLVQWFGPEVVEPIRLHAQAKRYLIATEPGYYDGLTRASRHSLSWQGAALADDERRRFAALPYARDAVALRRWDDRAKDPAAHPPPLSHYRALLEDLVNPPAAAPFALRKRG
ncbi:MAG: HD domain-containing protein [Betaproteobacteria bacterium]